MVIPHLSPSLEFVNVRGDLLQSEVPAELLPTEDAMQLSQQGWRDDREDDGGVDQLGHHRGRARRCDRCRHQDVRIDDDPSSCSHLSSGGSALVDEREQPVVELDLHAHRLDLLAEGTSSVRLSDASAGVITFGVPNRPHFYEEEWASGSVDRRPPSHCRRGDGE